MRFHYFYNPNYPIERVFLLVLQLVAALLYKLQLLNNGLWGSPYFALQWYKAIRPERGKLLEWAYFLHLKQKLRQEEWQQKS